LAIRDLAVTSNNLRRLWPVLPALACAALLSSCADMGDGWFGHKAATPAPAPATAATVEPLVKPSGQTSIPVLVNDVPITEYDVNQRQRLDRLGSGGKPVSRDKVIDELIDEMVESIEAQRQGVSVPDSQVDAAYANIAQHLKMNPAGLNKALASQGVDSQALKKRLRAQMLWQQLVQRRTVAKAKVTSEDIKQALAAKDAQGSAMATEYELQQIIFVVSKGSSDAFFQQRWNQAQAYRQRFAGCDQSIEQAKSLQDVVVKNIGRHTSADFAGPLGDAIGKTKVGAATAPQKIDQGIQLIAVCSSHEIQSNAQARTEAENSLYIKQAADLGKDYLDELRKQAIIERR
jgi:peptidyl-prolyl cis-trans isomerase SurA